MFNIIPLILILLGLTIIIVIVLRKFSILANLDINTIQAEREVKFKEQIISNKLKRNFFKYFNKIAKVIKPIGSLISNFFQWAHKKLVEFRENYNKEEPGPVDVQKSIDILFSESEDLLKKDNLEEAEKKYIKIISLDSKNIKAFKALGRLYFDRKDFNEAKQTFEHALKLIDKECGLDKQEKKDITPEKKELFNQCASLYYEIASTLKAMENYKGALVNINNALKIDSNNPRFLDIKLEICIINKNKGVALDVYEKLLEVNPENKKLEELKKQIDEL